MGGWGYLWQKNRNPLALPPGSLRNQIQIQAQSTAQDSLGGQTETWSTVLAAMAKLDTLATKEVYQTGQFTGQVTHRISLYWPGVSIAIVGGMRVLLGLYVTGTTTATSATVSAVTTPLSLTAGQAVNGPGIVPGTAITAVGSTTLTLSQAATASGTAVQLGIGPQRVFTIQAAENVMERNRVLHLLCLEINGVQ